MKKKKVQVVILHHFIVVMLHGQQQLEQWKQFLYLNHALYINDILKIPHKATDKNQNRFHLKEFEISNALFIILRNHVQKNCQFIFLVEMNHNEALSIKYLSIGTYCTYKSNMRKSQTVRLFIINLIQRSFKNVHIISSRVIAIGKKEEKSMSVF